MIYRARSQRITIPQERGFWRTHKAVNRSDRREQLMTIPYLGLEEGSYLAISLLFFRATARPF